MKHSFTTLRSSDLEGGHSLAWPSGVELGADMLWHETELAQARKGSWDDLRGMMKGNGARFTIEEINDAIADAGASAGMAGMGDHDRSCQKRRSGERRVGKESVRAGRSRWAQYH